MRQVLFRVTLTNTGTNETAIALMLTVEHNQAGVFSDMLTIVYVHNVSPSLLFVLFHFIS